MYGRMLCTLSLTTLVASGCGSQSSGHALEPADNEVSRQALDARLQAGAHGERQASRVAERRTREGMDLATAEPPQGAYDLVPGTDAQTLEWGYQDLPSLRRRMWMSNQISSVQGFDTRPTIVKRGDRMKLPGCFFAEGGSFGYERNDGGLTGYRSLYDCGAAGYLVVEETDAADARGTFSVLARPENINAAVSGQAAIHRVKRSLKYSKFSQSLSWGRGERSYLLGHYGSDLRHESWLLGAAKQLDSGSAQPGSRPVK